MLEVVSQYFTCQYCCYFIYSDSKILVNTFQGLLRSFSEIVRGEMLIGVSTFHEF